MTDFKRWEVTEPYVDIRCKLGEGPHYNEERHELRWLDIYGHKLHIVDLSKGPSSLRTVETGMPIGVTADIEGEDRIIIVGAEDGITKFDTQTGKHEYIARFWNSDDAAKNNLSTMRANDGAVDSEGRFWVEVFDDPAVTDPRRLGVLFRLNTDQSLQLVQEGLTIPNGISWNAKTDTMFLTDSAVRNVLAFDFDANSGTISNRRVWFHLNEDAEPDGHVMDVEGCIWQACWGASKVIRISPEGQIIGEISLPTRHITCPVFVGTELFITSAKEGEPEKYPGSAKYAGSVFRVDVGVRGVPKNRVRLQ